MVYLSRFYRLCDGVGEPDQQAFNGGTLGYLGYGIFRGDNRTFSVTLAIGTEDKELRALTGPARFDDAAALMPAAAPWIDPALSEPIAEAHTMAGLVNRKRDLVVEGDAARARLRRRRRCADLHEPAVRPRLLARRRARARARRRACRDHGDDLDALALAMHAAAEGRGGAVVRSERRAGRDEPAGARRRRRRADLAMSLITEGLLPLTRIDAKVGRAFFRTLNLLTSPNEVMSDPDLAARVFTYWQSPRVTPAGAAARADARGDGGGVGERIASAESRAAEHLSSTRSPRSCSTACLQPV